MKRSSTFYLVFLAITIALVLVFSWFVRENEQNEGLATIESEEGGITVSITPILPFGTESWGFQVELNTHTDSLPEDLKERASLIVNEDLTLSAISWEMSANEAHHKEGILSFQAAENNPDSLELILEDIGGVEKRTFTWRLK